MSKTSFSQLKEFFDRDVCQRATKPLRDGIQISIQVQNEETLTLSKNHGRTTILTETAAKPDMTFFLGKKAIPELVATQSEDIGEIGVAILKLMAQSNPDYKIKAKVHIGLFDLLRNGYLGVLPLGGGTVAKFLASKGFNGIGKIKEGISHLRE